MGPLGSRQCWESKGLVRKECQWEVEGTTEQCWAAESQTVLRTGHGARARGGQVRPSCIGWKDPGFWPLAPGRCAAGFRRQMGNCRVRFLWRLMERPGPRHCVPAPPAAHSQPSWGLWSQPALATLGSSCGQDLDAEQPGATMHLVLADSGPCDSDSRSLWLPTGPCAQGRHTGMASEALPRPLGKLGNVCRHAGCVWAG